MKPKSSIPRIPSDYDFVQQDTPRYPDDASITVNGERLTLNEVPDAFANGPTRRLTKDMIAAQVAEESGLTKSEATAAVDAVVSTIASALRDGDDVRLTGFGVFHVTKRGERRGRNPRTGATMTIAPSRTPAFRPGSLLKRHVA